MRALVVDDSRSTRLILKRILDRLGVVETFEAADGREALELLEADALPDLALIDWNMPVMDGFELVKAVRQRPEWNEMRILMVTTENGVDEVVRAMRAGANEYLMKPFDIDDVRAKLALMGLV